MAKMASYSKLLVLLAACARQAPRSSAGPPIHPARPPCGPSVPQSRAQRWRASARAETRSKRPFTHLNIESALAARESGYHPPNSPRHTIVTAQGFGESGGPRSAPRAPFCLSKLEAASRPAFRARTSSAPRRPRPSPVSPRVFRALRGARRRARSHRFWRQVICTARTAASPRARLDTRALVTLLLAGAKCQPAASETRPCEDLGRDATEASRRRRRSSAPRRPQPLPCSATMLEASRGARVVADVRRDFLARPL